MKTKQIGGAGSYRQRSSLWTGLLLTLLTLALGAAGLSDMREPGALPEAAAGKGTLHLVWQAVVQS